MAVNLTKKDINKTLSSAELIELVLKKDIEQKISANIKTDGQYNSNEILALLQNENLSLIQIGTCIQALAYIMDGFIDENMIEGVGPIYYHNGKFGVTGFSIEELSKQSSISNENDLEIIPDQGTYLTKLLMLLCNLKKQIICGMIV